MEEDYIKKLGYLSLASRLKRVSEDMIQNGRKLYRLLDIDIEPNWYLIFKILSDHGALSITEIAELLKFKHPSIITLTNKMIEKGYLISYKNAKDQRKMMVKLSDKSKSVLPRFEEIWNAFENAIINMLDEEEQLLIKLEQLESQLKKKDFMTRVLNEIK